MKFFFFFFAAAAAAAAAKADFTVNPRLGLVCSYLALMVEWLVCCDKRYDSFADVSSCIEPTLYQQT